MMMIVNLLGTMKWEGHFIAGRENRDYQYFLTPQAPWNWFKSSGRGIPSIEGLPLF